MSDNADKNLKVHVATTGDASGAKAVGGALDDVTNKAKKNTQEVHEQGKAHEFLGLRMGELKKLTRELGEQFPIAAMAARAFMNPLVFGITTSIALFGTLKEKLDEWNKALDEAGERAASHDFLPGIEAKRDALVEARQALVEFNFEMDHLITKESLYKQALSDSNALLNARFDAEKKVADAVVEAKVDSVNRDPRLTADEKRVQTEAIHRQAIADANAAQLAKEQKEVGDKAREADDRKFAQPGLDKAVTAAEEKALDEKGRKDAAKADIVKLGPKQEGYNKAANAALENVAEHEEMKRLTVREDERDLYDKQTIEPLRKIAKDAMELANTNQKAIDQAHRIAEAPSTADAELAKAKQEAKDNKEAQAAAAHDADMGGQKSNIRQKGADTAFDAGARSGDLGHDLTEAAQAERAHQLGYAATQKQEQAYALIIDLARKNHDNVAFLQTQMLIIAGSGSSIADKTAAIEKAAAELARRVDNLKMNTPG